MAEAEKIETPSESLLTGGGGDGGGTFGERLARLEERSNNFATKNDIAELKTELKNDIVELRNETKREFADVRNAIAASRDEAKNDNKDLKLATAIEIQRLKVWILGGTIAGLVTTISIGLAILGIVSG